MFEDLVCLGSGSTVLMKGAAGLDGPEKAFILPGSPNSTLCPLTSSPGARLKDHYLLLSPNVPHSGFTADLYLHYFHPNSHLCWERESPSVRLLLLTILCGPLMSPEVDSQSPPHAPSEGGAMLDSCLFSLRLSSDLLLSMFIRWRNTNEEPSCGCRRNRGGGEKRSKPNR